MAGDVVTQIEKKKQVVNIFHNPYTAWIILGLSLTFTVAAYFISANFVKQRAKDRFEFRAAEIEKAIEDRLQIYEQLLWSGVGMMYTHDQLVSRAQFAKFVESLSIEKHWPGIQGFGFAIPVKPEDKQTHIDSIRAQGFPDFTIKPEGVRDMYSSIIYLEPFDWRNKRAFGYDMWSNAMRREAMTRTRDEGAAVTSGIITLVQETEEDTQRGFLTYVPVYRTKNIPPSVKERREHFAGWVYAPYRAGNLMHGILGAEDPNIEFEIFDGESTGEDSLLYDTNSSLHLDDPNFQPAFTKTVKVTNQGRVWTIFLHTPVNFLTGNEQNQPRFVAIAGTIVDILLFYVIWSLYFINKRAEEMARRMTKRIETSRSELEETVTERTAELKQARDSLEATVAERTEELNKKIEELERTNDTMIGREKKMIELKTEIKQLKQKLDANRT